MAEPFATFTAESIHNIEQAPAMDDLIAAVESNNTEAAKAAVLAIMEFSHEKTVRTLTGAPTGTMLRNDSERAFARRVLNERGVPIWKITTDDDREWFDENVILEPIDQWKMVYEPPRDDEGAET